MSRYIKDVKDKNSGQLVYPRTHVAAVVVDETTNLGSIINTEFIQKINTLGNTIKTNGQGNLYLSDNGTYKEIITDSSDKLSLSGGTLTGILYTEAPTPLIIGNNGKIGLRAGGSAVGKTHVGQINISDSWYTKGVEWGAQMSAYNGNTDKYNAIRVSHNGPQYFDENDIPHQLVIEDDLDKYALKTEASGGFTIQSNPPENTSLLWIDTSEDNQNQEILLTIDSYMSDTSINPVQNKVIKSYIDQQIGDIISILETI